MAISNAQPIAQRDSRVGPWLAFASIIAFWFFYFSLNTFRMALLENPDQWGMIERRTVVCLAGIALTSVLYAVMRRFEGRSTGTLVTVAFLAAIPVSFASGAFNYTAFYVVRPLHSELEELAKEPPAHRRPLNAIIDYACDWYFFIVAWGVLYVALSHAAKVRQAERRAALYRAEAQSAQLRALRYQINPHFLFNTLNSLSSLVLSGRTEEAERMIVDLATFFRTSLAADPTGDVPLSEEVRMQRLYLAIEQTRFPERLVVSIDVPPELDDALVPGMILQPLVENAIKHGVARSARPVALTIMAQATGGRLRLTVEDDGEPYAVSPDGCGVGLRNVADRLAVRFDGEAACDCGPRQGGGFRVDLTLPLLQQAVAAQ